MLEMGWTKQAFDLNSRHEANSGEARRSVARAGSRIGGVFFRGPESAGDRPGASGVRRAGAVRRALCDQAIDVSVLHAGVYRRRRSAVAVWRRRGADAGAGGLFRAWAGGAGAIANGAGRDAVE